MLFIAQKKCLARFYWYQTRFYEEPMIYVSYGRLHAPFDKNIMLWNGQNCHCWHLINGILLFLDNRSPVDISMEDYVSPKILREFRETNISKSFPLGEYIAKEQLDGEEEETSIELDEKEQFEMVTFPLVT